MSNFNDSLGPVGRYSSGDPNFNRNDPKEIRNQFVTREGTYRLLDHSEYARPTRPPISNGSNNNSNLPVKVSLVRSKDEETGLVEDRICFNIGKEIYVYTYNGIKKAADLTRPLDKRIYRGTSPTCHDFNSVTARSDHLPLIIGFSAGQVQLVNPLGKENSKLFNEERLIDKSKVTCIKWLPGSPNQFLVSHAGGQLYIYHEELPSCPGTPIFQMFKQGTGYSVYTCKTKSTRNPLYKWSLDGGPTVNEFAFSPCSRYIAMACDDGFMRLYNFDQFEFISQMKSYFGGLLCVCWSPDGLYLATGGEDDLVTIYSFQHLRVICRGRGHTSWVNVIAFDPYVRDEEEDEDGDGDDDEAVVGGGYGGSGEGNNDCGASAVACSDVLRNHTCTRIMGNNLDSKPRIGRRHKLCSNSSSSSSFKTHQPIIAPHFNGGLSGGYDGVAGCGGSYGCGGSQMSGLDVEVKIASYRLGSVGQDTRLCLWDITDDVLKQTNCSQNNTVDCISHHIPETSKTKTSTILPLHLTRNSTITESGNKKQDTHNNSATTSTNISITSTSSTTTSVGYLNTSSTLSSSSGSSRLTSHSTSSDVSDAINNATNVPITSAMTTTLSKKSKSSKFKVYSTSTLPSIFTRNHNNAKKQENNNHTSSSSTTTTCTSTSSTMTTTMISTTKFLGTPTCPGLRDTPLIEPLTSKKIANERLNSLIFLEDCFVTSCQDGFVYTWARPGKVTTNHCNNPPNYSHLKSPLPNNINNNNNNIINNNINNNNNNNNNNNINNNICASNGGVCGYNFNDYNIDGNCYNFPLNNSNYHNPNHSKNSNLNSNNNNNNNNNNNVNNNNLINGINDNISSSTNSSAMSNNNAINNNINIKNNNNNNNNLFSNKDLISTKTININTNIANTTNINNNSNNNKNNNNNNISQNGKS